MRLTRTKMFQLLAFMVLGLLAGCASTNEDQETHSHGARPHHDYRSFATTLAPSSGPASDPAAMARLTTPALDAVRNSMVAKGYMEGRPAEADLLIKLRAKFKPDLLSETTKQRAFIIDIVDQRTDDRV